MTGIETLLLFIIVLLYFACGLAVAKLSQRWDDFANAGYFFAFIFWPIFYANAVTQDRY